MAPGDKLWTRRRQPHWLYRFFDGDGRLLYIGLTSNPATRMIGWRSAQRQGADWFGSVCRADWQRFENWLAGDQAERDAIASERPIHNIHHQAPLHVAPGDLFAWPEKVA